MIEKIDTFTSEHESETAGSKNGKTEKVVSKYDLVIVGAGIAGSATAIALAPEGYNILIVDKAVFPRQKPCGECIMPEGVQILSELGVLSDILKHGGVKVDGMRYWNRRGDMAQADFPPGPEGMSHALTLQRYDLDYLLLKKADSFSNVKVRQGFQVTEVIQEDGHIKGVAGHAVNSPNNREVFNAPLTIGTDGRYSIFHKACNLNKTPLPRRRFGLTGHLKGIEGMGSYVEVMPCNDGEIYIAPCGNDTTLVAILLEESAMKFFKGDLPGRFHEFLRQVDGFKDRITKTELVLPVSATGPLGFTIESLHKPGLLLIGDSSGFLDPITGEGMTLALKSVKAALPFIKEAIATGSFDEEMGDQYVQERFQSIEDVFRFTQFILNLSKKKLIADRAIRKLSRNPKLFQKFLGVATGSNKFKDISMIDKIILLLG